MAGDLDVPKVGKVDKKIIIPIVVAGAAFVGWRYYQASQGTGDDVAVDEEGDFGDGSSIPSVIGAVRDDNAYGSGSSGDSGNTQSSNPTTNAEWSNIVADKLSASDSWSYTDIVTALGNYLNARPLSTGQQQIVQAAIAVGGYPPVGSHTIIPGGNATITVAPSGLKASKVTADSVTLAFSAVPGAAGYRAYRGAGTNVGSSVTNTLTVSGLQPSTKYTFNVAAMTAAGTTGPHSSSITVSTSDLKLATPAKPRVSSVAKTSARVTTGAVKGATGYNWYINGIAHGHSDGPTYVVSGLKSRTTYRVKVAADIASQAGGKSSPETTFKTK